MSPFASGGGGIPGSRIAVLGAGRLGTAIASLAARHGHRVTLASRSPHRLAPVDGNTRVHTTLSHRLALESSDHAFLAVAWEHLDAVVDSLAEAQSGILVDCSNPEASDGRSLAVGSSTSGAELLAGRLPRLRVVKALNHVYAELLLGAPAAVAMLQLHHDPFSEVGLALDCPPLAPAGIHPTRPAARPPRTAVVSGDP